MFKSLLDLFYPTFCAGCERTLLRNEERLCLICVNSLAYNNFHDDVENPLEKRFWGRIELKGVTALAEMENPSILQKIIHALKYKGDRAVGVEMGKLLGQKLNDSKRFSKIDVILPVPLHPRKLKSRGYNQCQAIAEGLSETMGAQIENTILSRQINNSSQTKKTRFNRWLNVERNFAVKNPENLRGKNVLLVDDVITTGSTLEACGAALLKVDGINLYVAALAHA